MTMPQEPYDRKMDDKAASQAKQCRWECGGVCGSVHRGGCKYIHHQIDCPDFEPEIHHRFTGFKD
jgi:hypothetical protein